MENQKDNKKVFISHKSEDKSVAKSIIDSLRQSFSQEDIFCTSEEGYDIKIGEKWQEKIDAKLANCKYFLILCSENSIKSTFVWYELGFAKCRYPEVKIIPIIIDLEIEKLPLTIQEFQCVKYKEDSWEKKLSLVMSTDQYKKVYDWDKFNLSLEELKKLFDKNIININSPQINPIAKYKNIFDRLIKEKQISFATNDNGYISLTRYNLPRNLSLELLGAGYFIKNCIYYMRFISNSGFEKLLLDPKCKFSPIYNQ